MEIEKVKWGGGGSGGGWRVGVSADAAIQHSAEKRRVSGGQAPWLSAKLYLWQQCLLSFQNAGFTLSWQVHDHCDYCSAPRQSRFKWSHRLKINKATDQMLHIIGQMFCFVGFISDVTLWCKIHFLQDCYLLYNGTCDKRIPHPTPPHQTALKTNLLWNPCLHICTMYLPAPKATFLKTPWKSPLIRTSEKTTPSLWPLMGNPSSSQPFFPSKMQRF